MLGDLDHDLKSDKISLQKIQSHARKNKTLTQFYNSSSVKEKESDGTPSGMNRRMLAKRKSVAGPEKLLEDAPSSKTLLAQHLQKTPNNLTSSRVKVPPLPLT